MALSLTSPANASCAENDCTALNAVFGKSAHYNISYPADVSLPAEAESNAVVNFEDDGIHFAWTTLSPCVQDYSLIVSYSQIASIELWDHIYRKQLQIEFLNSVHPWRGVVIDFQEKGLNAEAAQDFSELSHVAITNK
jgi:hypothetical protein